MFFSKFSKRARVNSGHNLFRVKRTYSSYSLSGGVRRYPTRTWRAIRTGYKLVAIGVSVVSLIVLSVQPTLLEPRNVSNYTSVPGESYQVCGANAAQYLTSPWTYDALASGSQSYTVAQYEALNGYGTTLPSLPSYISNETSSTEAAIIYAPGSAVNTPAYDLPDTPLLHFFEGGAYNNLAFDSVSGDEFIGGSAIGYPEPVFDNGGGADGIDGQNGSYDFSGGQGTLAATAGVGATTLTTTAPVNGYIYNVNFADGTAYPIASATGNTITLSSPLTIAENAGTDLWASRSQPVASVATAAAQGVTTVTLSSSNIPLMEWANAYIGSNKVQVQSVSGSQNAYTLTLSGGLDTAVVPGTPVYYSGMAGAVTVDYLNINNDQHLTTGTFYTGSGWTIEHNDIHDGYSKGPGYGVAIYGGGNGTIEYNCLSKMGDYGIQADGTNNVFDYNEVYESNYEADPGCGCSGGGKWWGTLNADIVDNAFIGDGYGGGGAIWLDNGNSGTLISGNYFYQTYGQAISQETGFNTDITDNLFEDDGWASGTGCGNSNCAGDVGINTSGGAEVPGSRYENELLVSGNQFLDDWGGLAIWQSGSRSCENSGEGWQPDAPYCSGGFPNTNTTAAGNQYYFTHEGDAINGGTGTLEADASSSSSTVLVQGNEAINDQIDFVNPATATTSDTTDVTTFTGTGSITVGSTTGFPSSGQLLANTSAGQAVLAYTGTTSTTFTGVQLVNDPDVAGTGTLSGMLKVNDPAYATTTDTTVVTNFTGTQSFAASTTAGFPSSGQLRVGTSGAWGGGGGSYTGAILAYTGISGNSFTGVSLVRGSGSLGSGGPTAIMGVQPYKVTGETCFANDCEVNISPTLSSSISARDAITNAGTCQLFATSAATPTSPVDPASTSSPYYESYWDGCQWEARNISVTGNTFTIQPSLMDITAPLKGGTTSCLPSNNCGTNFMSDQPSGEKPFGDQTGANAMMSNSNLTGCPSWDAGCISNPLKDINALSNAPNAPPGNGEAPFNDVWSDNSYAGAWSFNTFIYGNCYGSMPTDPTTNATLPISACGPISPSTWQADWQQDQGSTYNPMIVSIGNIADDDTIHGASENVEVYEDTVSGNTINSTLLVGSNTAATVSPLSTSPYTFSLNTTPYTDGQYTLKVSGTDSGSNIGSDSVPVYITNGDLNGDGKVNLSDLIILAQNYGKSGTFTYSQGNITGATSGNEVNLSDLIILAQNYGYNDGLGH